MLSVHRLPPVDQHRIRMIIRWWAFFCAWARGCQETPYWLVGTLIILW